jgi:hypothetical protein
VQDEHTQTHQCSVAYQEKFLLLVANWGGGCKIVNVTRCWTYETALVLGE